MSGIALRRRSLRSRLGFGPHSRSGVRQLHWCGFGIYFNAKWATAHRAHTKAWPLRTLLVLTNNRGNIVFYMCPFFCGWVGQMMECTAVALDEGRRVVPQRPLTYTSSIDVFLQLYEHRCVSSPWSVWGVGGECNRTDELLNDYLEAVALAAPKHKANSTACW